MQVTSFYDDSFDLLNSKRYNLSIQASLDGFSVLLEDCKTHSYMAMVHMPYKLSSENGLLRKTLELLQLNKLLNRLYHKVTVFIDSNSAKLIPGHLVNEKQLKQLFSIKPKDTRGKTFFANPINHSYHLVFICSSDVVEFFNTHFGPCEFVHETTPLIKKNLHNSMNETVNIHLFFHSEYYYVSASKKNEILFFNSFAFKSPEDILFYLFSSIRLLDTEKCDISVSGYIEEQDSSYTIIKKYFPEARLISGKDYRFSNGQFNQMPVHKITPVLSDTLLT
jgi:hypothetical protein